MDYLHRAGVREAGDQVQPSAHGRDVTPDCAQVGVSASFELGQVALADVQDLDELLRTIRNRSQNEADLR